MKDYCRKILSLFVRHNYSEQTNQLFYTWLIDSEHEIEKDEALRELYLEARKKGKTPDLEKSLERWRQNNNTVSTHSQNVFNKIPFVKLWQSAAVVLLIVSISLGYLLHKVEKNESDLVQQFMPTTQMKTFILSDGSQVQMNSRSILLYPTQFTGKDRSVFLIGEANFKIKPNKKKPFIVKTNDFQVTALGTEFNVSAYAEEENVFTTLIKGSVLVKFDNLTKQVLLHPNEQLVYNKESRQDTLTYPNLEEVTAWQRGELVFRQKTIADIITILERKYDYKFIYSLHSLKNDRYSFRFKDNAPLSEVMDVIVDVAGDLYFNIQNDKCYIMHK
ncbi:FecR family protein [Bacteroides cellulosilyticus]|uniref:FecR family protein n=1 Tax=Bacteroides cellulosilyticus TaxID=246787 RepID=UPI00356608FB